MPMLILSIGLATQRLMLVTGPNPYDWTKSLSEYISQNVLEFTPSISGNNNQPPDTGPLVADRSL